MAEPEIEWESGGRLASVKHNYAFIRIRGILGMLFILVPLIAFAVIFFASSGAMGTVEQTFLMTDNSTQTAGQALVMFGAVVGVAYAIISGGS